MAGSPDAIARVQRWDERRFIASCPYCDKTHGHGFGGDPRDRIEYSAIGRRAADCRGGDYVVVFPFDAATNQAGYEIDKRERQFVSAFALDGQASAVDSDAGGHSDDDKPVTGTPVNRPNFDAASSPLHVKQAFSDCVTGKVRRVEAFITQFRDTDNFKVFLFGENYYGDTALYSAAMETSSKMVKLLLRHGCDVNAQNHRGRTPLMAAALWGRPRNARALLEYGADKTLRDVDGKLAIDLAQYTKKNERERFNQGVKPKVREYVAREADWTQVVVLLGDQATQDQLFGFHTPDSQRPRYALQPDSSFALVTPIVRTADPTEGEWAQVALLARGGQFPTVFATSRDVGGVTMEIAVGGQSLSSLVARITALIGFALPPGPSGEPSANHAEMGLIAYFVDKHVFLPDELVTEEELQQSLWRQDNYGYYEEDEAEARTIALTQLKRAQPPVRLTQATILATTAICRHCEEFCRRVNARFGLELTLEYRREGDASSASVVLSFEYLAGRCGAMHEAEELCRSVLSRLEGHLGDRTIVVQPGRYTSTATEEASVEAVAARFYLLLEQHGSKPVVRRLVSARSLVDALRDLQGELDRLGDDNNGPHSWQPQWESGVAAMKQQLARNAEQNARSSELSDSAVQQEALTLLVHELTTNKDHYSDEERKLLKRVLFDIAELTKARVPEVEEWFIPRHEVIKDRKIGSGSFATVFLGVWRKTTVVVKCVKVQSEVDKRTFLREVRIWQQARHPNIVQFLGACHVGEESFIVCEYAAGGTLTNYLFDQREAGRSVAWRKLLQVALALYFLHERKEPIVHGDLKVDNILMSEDGDVKLSDFGLSFEQSGSRAQPEEWGAIHWRAPEVVLSNGVDTRTKAADVYSLGVCIVRAVAGRLPWGDLSDRVAKYHLKRKTLLSKPDEMTDAEWKLVERMCAFEPSERMPLADVIEQLETFAAEEKIAERTRPVAAVGSST